MCHFPVYFCEPHDSVTTSLGLLHPFTQLLPTLTCNMRPRGLWFSLSTFLFLYYDFKNHVNVRRHSLMSVIWFSSVWGNYFIEALYVPFIWLISTFPGVLLSDRCYRWVTWDAWKGFFMANHVALYPKIIGTAWMIWELHNCIYLSTGINSVWLVIACTCVITSIMQTKHFPFCHVFKTSIQAWLLESF